MEGQRLAEAGAGPRAGRQHRDPAGLERRRRDGQEARVRRQARARHRLRVLPQRRHRLLGAGHLVPGRHQRRRGRRQAHEALHGARHLRHARRHQQPPLGSRRLDLRDARLQHRHGHHRRRRQDARSRQQWRRPLQTGRRCVRAVQQPRRQHVGPRHHVGRPGLLDPADERHGVLPHRAAGVRAGAGPHPQHDLLQGHDRRAEDLSGDRRGRNRPTPRSIWSGSSRRRPAAPSTTAAPGPIGGGTATSRPSRPSTWCITSS